MAVLAYSWTAIGRQRGGNRSEQRLYRYAVMHLVGRKHLIFRVG